MSSKEEERLLIINAYPAGAPLLQRLGKAVKNEKDRGNIVAGVARLVDEASASVSKEEPVNEVDTSQALSSIPDLRFTTPSGKFTLFFMEDCLVIKNDRTGIKVPKSALKLVAVLDRVPKEARKKVNEVVLFIVLDQAVMVMNGKKQLCNFVIQTCEDAVVAGHGAQPVPVVLCSLLGQAGLPHTAFLSPDDDVYQSLDGGPAIVASHGKGSGWLYPLEAGLFVEKPATFIPLEEINSFEILPYQHRCELILHMKTKDTRGEEVQHEFGFDKPELPRLQSYLSNCRIREFSSALIETKAAKGRRAGTSDSQSAAGASSSAQDEDDEDEDDDDFDPQNVSDDEEVKHVRPAKRSRRGAASGDAEEEPLEELEGDEDILEDDDGEIESGSADEDEESEEDASGDSDD